MAFEGPEKKRKVLYSMIALAAVLGGAVFATAAVTTYLRSQDPINQCITEPSSQPFQISVPITVTKDGAPFPVEQGVGMDPDCIRPVHTLEENVIHVAYGKPHEFTLGHFFYYWLGQDLLKYDATVRVNDVLHSNGDIRDIELGQGDSIRIDLTTKNQ
ncbi:MAG TPA: hypothetical protein VIE86_04725 [Nitrososphaera sp.]